jgi:hypothetical protein
MTVNPANPTPAPVDSCLALSIGSPGSLQMGGSFLRAPRGDGIPRGVWSGARKHAGPVSVDSLTTCTNARADMLNCDAMRPDVLAQLRRAIERSPLSQAEIARAADLKESVVSRFRRGSELTVINAQRIAKAIGHRLVLERVKVKKTAKKGDR